MSSGPWPEPSPPGPTGWPQADVPRPTSAATPFAWVLYGLGVVLLGAVGIFSLFLVAQASSGCDLADPRARPAVCGSRLEPLMWLAPLAAIVLYVVGGALGIVWLRRSAWSLAVPIGLGLLAVGVLIGVPAVLD